MMLVGTPSVCAIDYYTAIDGDDSNPGTSESPWQTIQKAANAMLAGDTVIVRAGTYDERISTVSAGTSQTNRITFQAEGEVIVKGWEISHAYTTVSGFDITGWSSSNRNNAHVSVKSGGDYFELLNCNVRDGIQITRDDVTFHSGFNTISSATGGFLDARFAPGQSVLVGAATNGQSIANSGVHSIVDVTDKTITVSSALSDDGPLFVYLSSSFVFGLLLNPGTENCVVRGNTFSNLGYDAWFILGDGHVLESNIVEQVNGWDAMHFGGSGHMFYRNAILNSPLVVYQVSPDAMENFPPQPYVDVTFLENYIQGFAGVLASQKGQDSSTGLLLSHNVFVDVGRLSLTHPDTTILNNTFLRVAATSNPVTSPSPHPVAIHASSGATNTWVQNNVFVDCGVPGTGETDQDVGWYEIGGPTNSITAEFNFVAGAAPDFEAKNGFDEGSPDLNGGDPGFVNIDDPLGPDGMPFTEDDGLRLQADSKLRAAGAGGVDLGAYLFSPAGPVLHIVVLEGEMLQVTWPASFEGYTLQSAESLNDVWVNEPTVPTVEGNTSIVTISPTVPTQFYMLDK